MHPRILIAAPKSGSGKTTLTCALLKALQNLGKSPVAFKCGPDFIDPLFHERVLGIHGTNLDSFFSTDDEVRSVFAENFSRAGADCAVIEGVMGLFDGLAGKSLAASTYDIARITNTPIILTVDAGGMSRSVVALVRGFLEYDKSHSDTNENLIKGIFLNKVSEGSFRLLKPLIEDECAEYGVKVVGFLPDSPSVWKSRHLGLFLPTEIADLNEQIEKTAATLSETLDFPLVEKIMRTETSLNKFQPFNFQFSTFNFPIAVARDEAFCFYYRENLRLLEEAGAKLEYFSPLHDSAVPSGARGILLGGGYPELYASRLQENVSMRESIKSAVKNGISVMAECGGFMYLQEKLTTETGESYEMCGAIEGECFYTGKLVRFGYADFAKADGLAFGGSENGDKNGFSIKGHEFHYFDSTNNGASFTATKPLSSRSWECMIHTPKMLAGFPHLYYRSNPEIVRWFLESCK